VDPEQPGAALVGKCARQRSRPISMFQRQSGGGAEKPLAGRSYEDGLSQGLERSQAIIQFEVLLRRLGESKAGVHHDRL
jgi:hypothetical protein